MLYQVRYGSSGHAMFKTYSDAVNWYESLRVTHLYRCIVHYKYGVLRSSEEWQRQIWHAMA